MPPTAPAKKATQVHINRLFDDTAEIMAYINGNFKDQNPHIVKTWNVTQIACIIEFGGEKKPEPKKETPKTPAAMPVSKLQRHNLEQRGGTNIGGLFK